MAAAAYRSGSILRDERAGKTHRYQNRSGVADTFILAPSFAPKNLLTRAVLWNAAEASETRKNSRVAREVILALPHELSDKDRAELTRDMGLYLLERYRVAVDVAIHAPTEGDGHDPRNHHAHLLFTTREITKDGLGAKTRILDDKVSGPQEIEIIREVWETLANDALERAGFADAKIDRRTLEAQGLDRIPQTHEGKAARNAAAYQSFLAKDFQKADKGDDDEDDEEESSGEKSSSSSSSSGGGSKSGALTSKEREDDKGRPIDYVAIDKERTRTAFNTEIKALNEKRAAFGDKPLTEQIAQLDRLMERLDKRMEKLQALETKTSLKSVIKQSIASAVKLAADLITNRKEAKAVLRFTAEEKQARTERKLTRYGRDYRQGLHNQIKEMKQNIAILEQKQKDFKNYKSFVDKIDMELKKHDRSITAPFKEKAPPKQTTDKEINLKLHLRAEMIRAQIPAEFKPSISMKGERATLTASTAVNKVLQAKGEPIKIDRAAFAASKAKPETKPYSPLETRAKPKIKFQPTTSEAPPIKSAFTSKAEAQPTPKTQAEYKQPMPVKIKAMEKAIAERQVLKAETLKPEERKSWFTPANEKTKPLQQLIGRKLPELKATEPQVKKALPLKQVTTREVTEKTRAEANVKRESVPQRHQPKREAEPVKALFKGLEREIQKQKADKTGASLRSKFTAQVKQKQPSHEPKRATNETLLQRTRETAEKIRNSIPEQYRAKPYEAPKSTPEHKEPRKDNIQSHYKEATSHKPQEASNPRPKMSEGFNMNSGFKAATESTLDKKLDDEPEMDI